MAMGRRSPITRKDWGRIVDALEFILAGEFPFGHGLTPAQEEREREAFNKLSAKASERSV